MENGKSSLGILEIGASGGRSHLLLPPLRSGDFPRSATPVSSQDFGSRLSLAMPIAGDIDFTAGNLGRLLPLPGIIEGGFKVIGGG